MSNTQEHLPQSEGADWFLVIDPKEGIVHHAYTADLGRSFGHDHIKDAQYNHITGSSRWVVRPAYAAQQTSGEGCDVAALTRLAEQVARLNPNCAEIGAGMLAELVANAKRALGHQEGGAT